MQGNARVVEGTEVNVSGPVVEVRPVLRARGLRLDLPGRRTGVLRRRGAVVRVVNSVDLDIRAGDVVWLVGADGEGALETGMLLAGDRRPTAGTVEFDGRDLSAARGRRRARVRRRLVRLDPADPADLDPRRTAHEIVAEAAAGSPRAVTSAHRAEAAELVAAMGVAAGSGDVRTAALTDDDRHLVDAARVVALRPRVVVYRPARDARVGDDRVWAALIGLPATSATALVVVSERLPPMLGPGDRALVLCGGRIVEVLRSGDLTHPLHPYTVALRGAPEAGPVLDGSVDRPAARVGLSDGCPFRRDCPRAKDRCSTEVPRLSRPLGATHDVACHFPEDPRPPQDRGPAAGGGSREAGLGSAAELPSRSDEPTAREFAEG